MSFLETDETRTDPDDALRLLLERAHQIREMEATPGWAIWRDFLAAEAVGYQNRLLKGRHKDMLDYRYDAGFCEGIRTAIGVSDTLAARIEGAREVLALTDPLAMEEDDERTAA